MTTKLALGIAITAASLTAETLQFGSAQGNFGQQYYLPSQMQSYLDGRALVEYQNQFGPNLLYAPMLDKTFIGYEPVYSPQANVVVQPPANLPPLTPVIVAPPVFVDPPETAHLPVPEASTVSMALLGGALLIVRNLFSKRKEGNSNG